MRQQLIDPVVRMSLPLQHVLEVGPRIVAVQLDRLHEAHHHGRSLAGHLASREQLRLPALGPRAHLILDVVVVHTDRAGLQEAAQRTPTLGKRAAIPS